MSFLAHCLQTLHDTPIQPMRYGRVRSVVGLLIEATGVDAAVGDVCLIHEGHTPAGRHVPAEVVGVRSGGVLLMPLEETIGIANGNLVTRAGTPLRIQAGPHLLGRILDATGRPIDGKGALMAGTPLPVHRDPPNPLSRRMISQPLRTGVRAIDSMLTLGKGQRIGIFAGSGVGKSTLLGMMARSTQADINVIALLGERGREVREFIEDSLGEEGLRRSVVVAVTSDQAALSRVKGAFVAMAIAEYFRDHGKDVLLMMDSVTRMAMAQREIGLAVGEPPTTRGYTPSVFSLLPRLLERAGPGERGTITGLFTVLVDGDDMNEPVADAVRGILDGHIVLSRRLAQEGHFPAIDILQSVSRLMPKLVTSNHLQAAEQARKLLADFARSEDLVRVGAYAKGSDPATDRAIKGRDPLRQFLQQRSDVVQRDPAEKQLEHVLAGIR